jgi:hypothetical protein
MPFMIHFFYFPGISREIKSKFPVSRFPGNIFCRENRNTNTYPLICSTNLNHYTEILGSTLLFSLKYLYFIFKCIIVQFLAPEEVSYYAQRTFRCPTPGCRGIGRVRGHWRAAHNTPSNCPYAPQNLSADSQQLPDRLRGPSEGEYSLTDLEEEQDIMEVGKDEAR